MDDKAKIGLENLKEIEERLKEIKERTSEFVKEHPLTSIAIAASVGFIIAKLISGRRS
ncbi:MAG: DUF883 family protein [Rhizobacter sp.]|nr:DUF883 family protein [Bacteriovorax sp.]